MRLRVVGVVALLIATAGCSAFVGGPSEVETLTPAEVPTPEPTPTDPRVGVAPGISADGVTHPEFLAQRHAAAANETSYVWRQRYRERRMFENVSANVSRDQRIVVENATTFRREAGSHNDVVDGNIVPRYGYSVYADGQTKYRSWIDGRGDGRVFRRIDTPSGSASYARLPTGNIATYLTLDSATVARYEVAGSDAEHYLVTGTRDSLPEYSEISNYTARAVVREDGFVRELRITFDAVDQEATLSARYEFTYTDVGTATVSPPEWYDDARAEFEDV